MFRFLMGGSASQPAPAAQQQQAVQPAASGGSDSRTVRTGLAKRVEEAEQQLAQAEIRLQTATAEMNAAAKANNSSAFQRFLIKKNGIDAEIKRLNGFLTNAETMKVAVNTVQEQKNMVQAQKEVGAHLRDKVKDEDLEQAREAHDAVNEGLQMVNEFAALASQAVGEQVDDSEIQAQMAATRAEMGVAEPAPSADVAAMMAQARASMGVVQPPQDALSIYNENNAKLTAVQAALPALATQPPLQQLPVLAHEQQQLTAVQTSLMSTVAVFQQSGAIQHWQALMTLHQQLSAQATAIQAQAVAAMTLPVQPAPQMAFQAPGGFPAQGFPALGFPAQPFPAQGFPAQAQQPFPGAPPLQMPVPIAAAGQLLPPIAAVPNKAAASSVNPI